MTLIIKPITENSRKKITNFWNYFQKNEQEIVHAILLGIRTEEVIDLLAQQLKNVSPKIEFLINLPKNYKDKFAIIFSGKGYQKLFATIIAIENQAPELNHFIAQSFIKPLENPKMYKDGSDKPCVCRNFEIKISDIQMTVLEYNSVTEQLKIDLYLPNYNGIKDCEGLNEDINWIVMCIIGEIAFRKHIKEIKVHPIPVEPFSLLNLLELTDYIAYLHAANQFSATNNRKLKTDNRKLITTNL